MGAILRVECGNCGLYAGRLGIGVGMRAVGYQAAYCPRCERLFGFKRLHFPLGFRCTRCRKLFNEWMVTTEYEDWAGPRSKDDPFGAICPHCETPNIVCIADLVRGRRRALKCGKDLAHHPVLLDLETDQTHTCPRCAHTILTVTEVGPWN